MATLLAENADHFLMHDGRSEFRVPMKGLSEALKTKIRGMGRKMAEGGPLIPELTVDDIDTGMTPAEALSPEDAPAGDGMVFEEGIDLSEPTGELAAATLPVTAAPEAAPPEAEAPGMVFEEGIDLTPSAEPVPEAAPSEVPSAPSQPTEKRSPYDLKDEAAKEKFEAARKAGAAKNAFQQGYLDEAAQLANREAEVRQSVQAAAKEYAQRLRKAEDFMADAGGIDQGHYWASQSTGGKILGAIGLVLGAIGASKDGVNRAALLMDKAIERDIATQRLNYEMRLKKGAQMGESARNFYALAKQIADNDLAAVKNAEALARKKLDVQLKAVDSSTDNLNAKSNLKEMIADNDIKRIKAEQDAAKIVSDAAQRKFSNAMAVRNTVAHETEAAAARGMAEAKFEREKEQDTEKDIASAAKALGEVSSTEEAVSNLKDLRKKNKGALPGLDFATSVAGALPGNIGSYLKSPDDIATLGYIDDLVRESLHRSSGAGVSDKERAMFLAGYGLTPGSSAEARRIGTDRLIADAEKAVAVKRAGAKPEALETVEKRAGIKPSGVESAEVTKAKRWLLANPNHPDAPGVRARLAKMGVQ